MGINDYIKIGSRIKRARMEKGISQREMSEMLGIPYSTYSNYENNNREPSIEVIEKIVSILGVSVESLLAPCAECDRLKDSKNVSKGCGFMGIDEKALRAIDANEELTELVLRHLVSVYEVYREDCVFHGDTLLVKSIVQLGSRYFAILWWECGDGWDVHFDSQPSEVEKHTYQKQVTATEWRAKNNGFE